MDIFGLGLGEIILILVLALIVFGPSKLPEMAAQIGRVVRDIRRSASELSTEFNQTLKLEIEREEAPKGLGASSTEPKPSGSTAPSAPGQIDWEDPYFDPNTPPPPQASKPGRPGPPQADGAEAEKRSLGEGPDGQSPSPEPESAKASTSRGAKDSSTIPSG